MTLPTKKPERLLRKIRVVVNRNLRETIKNHHKTIIPPVPKKFLPVKCYLRDLYNQIYYSHYAGLYDASVALLCICFERVSRDLHEHFIGEPPRNWERVLNGLNAHLKQWKGEDREALIEFVKNMFIVKDDVRNVLLHSNVEEYVQDTFLVHRAYNVNSQQWEPMALQYDSELHENKFGEIKAEKTGQISHKLLILLSMVLIQFDKHIEKKPYS